MIQQIAQYARDRKYRRTVSDEGMALRSARANNCGDSLTMCCVLRDDCIQDICYNGEACQLCCAAAHLMCMQLHNRAHDWAYNLVERLLALASKRYNNISSSEIEVDPVVLHALSEFSGRRACILLPWQAISDCLK